MADDMTGGVPFTAPTFDPTVFENVDWTAAPTSQTTPAQTSISQQDVNKQMTDYQSNIMSMIKDLQGQRSFGGPGLTDIQQLQSMMKPRAIAGGTAPGMSTGDSFTGPAPRVGLMSDYEFNSQLQRMIQQLTGVGQAKLGLQSQWLDKLFGSGGGSIIQRILGSLGGFDVDQGGGTNPQVGDIVKAMEALNADNARKQQEALTGRFAAAGRSPSSSVLSDMVNRIAQSQSLANIQGAGQIEQLQLPLAEERQRLASNLIQTILSQVLGGAFNVAGSAVGG